MTKAKARYTVVGSVASNYRANMETVTGHAIRSAGKAATYLIARHVRMQLKKNIRVPGIRRAVHGKIKSIHSAYVLDPDNTIPLVLTGFYLRKILVKKNCVGVPRIPVAGTSISLGQLAKFLEYGTRNSDAIPHWRPALQDSKEELKQIMKETVKNALRGRQELPGEDV